MPFFSRKLQRLKNYDYSQNNSYFLTVCTQNKKHILGNVADGKMVLSEFGKQVDNRILNIEIMYKVKIENYVIMPNHIHILLLIDGIGTTQGFLPLNKGIEGFWATAVPFPTVSQIMQELKSVTTLDYINGVKSGSYEPFENKIWQKSFHDHIIRNKNDYLKIWEYIDNNPLKWDLDCYYN